MDLTWVSVEARGMTAQRRWVYSGVEARIHEMEPLAEYVHCTAHNLNLTLNDLLLDTDKVLLYRCHESSN